ncbi:hypothetical protein PAESOLCIP111_05195 [Paenibacillus solanacearum]|uniref:DUF975 family protein n=1 Tax=Paenibacillus solanacearum TaxID=2048548 RepID=A0A916K723_9BACL|nr:DUF975 family protein [Paenibacillus solanacearum]CAG7646577.1 hypothetical protein PAESOLCIP111_05195 [Paenibacillus solanacearum]
METETIRSRGELKQEALQQLKGNWGKAVAVALIMMAIGIVISLVPKVGDLIQFIVAGPLTLGMVAFFLRLIRREPHEVQDIFSGFSRFVPSFLLYLLSAVFVFLWTLLLIVPGIIAGLRYAMAFYIMNDHPELTAMEAIERSKQMMYGHKWRYFVLQLSFIGWGLLCVLTLGIGLLWLIPYMATTTANFYEDLSRSVPEAPPLSPPA